MQRGRREKELRPPKLLLKAVTLAWTLDKAPVIQMPILMGQLSRPRPVQATENPPSGLNNCGHVPFLSPRIRPVGFGYRLGRKLAARRWGLRQSTMSRCSSADCVHARYCWQIEDMMRTGSGRSPASKKHEQTSRLSAAQGPNLFQPFSLSRASSPKTSTHVDASRHNTTNSQLTTSSMSSPPGQILPTDRWHPSRRHPASSALPMSSRANAMATSATTAVPHRSATMPRR
jgi:hypothetical protein